MNRDEARAKIAKLMAMASDKGGASKQEVETALRHAEAMMRKHGIEQSEIHAAGGALTYNWEAGYYAFGRDGKPVKSNPDWFGWVAVSVANFTDTIVVQKNDPDLGYGVMFRGDEEDVVFALWLIGYLKDAIRKATKEAKLSSSSQRETFRKSMALGLCNRMRDLIKERHAAFQAATTSTSNALVVVTDKLAKRDEFFGGPRYKKGKGVKMNDRETAGKGFEAAQKVQFNRPIGNPVSGAHRLCA